VLRDGRIRPHVYPGGARALRDGYAPLQDARCSALVQLAIDESERLGHPGNAPSLGSIRGEFLSIHPGDVLVAPVPLAGGRLYVHGLGLDGAIPLDQGEHVRLVRGILVHGLHAYWIRGSPRGFFAARGAWLEVDRWLSDVSRKNVRGNSDSPRSDFGELIRLLVAPVRHVVKFYAIELVLEGSHSFAVRLHLVIVTARILHDLVNHEL
jgi:hypothetical protein